MTTEDKENNVNLELLSNIASEAKYQEEGKQDSIKLNRKRYSKEDDEIIKSIYKKYNDNDEKKILPQNKGARTEAARTLNRSVNSISARYRDITKPHESRKRKNTYRSLYNTGGRKTKKRPLKKKRNTRLRGGYETTVINVDEEFINIIDSMGTDLTLDVNKLLYLMAQPAFNINIQAEYGYTALMAASKFGYKNFAKLLVKKADINMRDDIGTTALIFASDNGHAEIVQMLLEAGAKVNLRNDIWAQTALHRASHSGHIEIVELLLTYGADVNLEDGFGATALTWASSERHSEIVDILNNRIIANTPMEQIRNKSLKLPSLSTLAHRALLTDDALSVNNLNMRSPSKFGGKKRRSRKRI